MALAQTGLWSKRSKIIAQKGTQKRIKIKWHFITSDSKPHTVILQHTQDIEQQSTHRILWVDGREICNKKSSAASYNIAMDKDVVVVRISNANNKYEYNLTINDILFEECIKNWKSKQKGDVKYIKLQQENEVK